MHANVADAVGKALVDDDDAHSVLAGVVPGAQASMFYCRIVLYRGEDPERSLQRALAGVERVWKPDGSVLVQGFDDRYTAYRKMNAVVDSVLEAENLRARGVKGATLAHFSTDLSLVIGSLGDLKTLGMAKVGAYAQRYLGQARGRAVLFVPGPGDGVPLGVDAVRTSATVRPGLIEHAAGVDAGALHPSFFAPDEPDAMPVGADEGRLGVIAPGFATSAFRRFVLPNGLDVLVGRRPGLPVATLGLALGGGAGAETGAAGAEIKQLAASTSSLRSALFGSRDDIKLFADAELYYAEGSADHIDMMVEDVATQVQSVRIHPSDWGITARFLLPSLRVTERRGPEQAARAFEHTLLAGSPYGRSATTADLEAAGVGDAKEWVERTHSPRNAALAVLGDFDPAFVEAKVREHFGAWKSAGARLPAPPPPPPGTGAAAPRLVVTPQPGARHAQIRFGCLLPEATTSAADTLHDVAAQVIETWLLAQLRERLGAAHPFAAGAHLLRGGTAYLALGGAVANKELAPALVALREALTTLAGAAPSAGELAWAKRRLAQREATLFMTNRSLVAALLAAKNAGFDWGRHDTYARELAAVGPEQVWGDFRACAAGRPTLSVLGDEAAVRAAHKAAWP